MSIDILENSATNNSRDNMSQVNDNRNSASLFRTVKDTGSDVLGGLGSVLMGTATVVGKYGAAIPRYIIDTLTAESNDVPFYVRAAVAAAPTATDKLKTLRRYYPDAMPSGANDFTFRDPESKKRFTLDDKGLSIGDVVSNIPAIGEMVGGTAGAIGGGLAGGAATGGVGAIPAGAAGGAAGGVAGKEVGTKLAKYLGYAGSGFKDEPLDTQSSSDYRNDMFKTAAINAVGGALGPSVNVLKNSVLKKLLTEESAGLAKTLSEKGYSPTLSQIGSEKGAALNRKIVENKAFEKELQNMGVLQKNTDEFLGSVSSLDQNALANKLRSELQDKIAKKYGMSKEAYENLVYRDDYVPKAEVTRGAISDVYKKRGMVQDENGTWAFPENKRPNSDFVFERRIEDKIEDVLNGAAPESELFAFEKDLTPLINDRNTAYRTRESMVSLRDAIRKDLASGEGMDDKARVARQAHYEYKNAQEKLDNAIGKTEGISEGIAAGSGSGLTAGQNLDKVKKLYLRSSAGDDAKASILNEQLSRDEKRLVLASMLKEPLPMVGQGKYINPVENLAAKYDTDRIASNLLEPEEAGAFADLLMQSKGTMRIPKGAEDLSGNITPEALATLGVTAGDPQSGALLSAVLNMKSGTPGMTGGSGTFLSSMYHNNPISKGYDKLKSTAAIKAAMENRGPSNLKGVSPLYNVGNIGGAQTIFGNIGDASNSNLRIPQSVREENLPIESRQRTDAEKIDFDKLIAPNQSSSIDLDNLIGLTPSDGKTLGALGALGAQSPENPSPPVNTQVPPPPSQKLGVMDVENYINQTYKKGESSYDGEVQPALSSKDVEDYIAQNYTKETSVKDKPSGRNEASENLLSDLRNGKPYYKTEMFSEGLKSALAEIESGVKGYSAQAHNSSAAGKYQFLDATRKSLLPGVSREEFINTPALQEEAMNLLIQDNIKNFKNRGIDVDTIDPSDLTGLLFAAHLRGPSQAAAVYRDRNYQGIPDPNGTTPRSYFDRGKRTYENA